MKKKLNEVKQKGKEVLAFTFDCAKEVGREMVNNKEYYLLISIATFLFLHDRDVVKRLHHLEYDFTHLPMDKLVDIKVKEVE